MPVSYIGLGSNIEDRLNNIQRAIEQIDKNPLVNIREKSSIYESVPWGIPNQPKFMNCVLELETKLTPLELLSELQKIEAKLGRIRETKWGPRIIDIDILLYDDSIINSPLLTIPHKYMLDRAFVIIPLKEIAPDVIHPVVQKKVKELAEKMDSDDLIKK